MWRTKNSDAARRKKARNYKFKPCAYPVVHKISKFYMGDLHNEHF